MVRNGFRPVHFEIVKETEKAVLCTVRKDWDNGDNTVWFPKSVCIITKEDTEVRYMNSVTAVADWFLVKNRIK